MLKFLVCERSHGSLSKFILQASDCISGHSTKVQGGMLGDSRSFPVVESGFASATQCSNSSYNNHGLFAKMHMERSIEALSAASSPSVELSHSRGAVNSEHWKHGYMKGVVGNTSEKLLETNLFSGNRGEEASASLSTGKVVEHDGGIPNALSNTNSIVQVLLKPYSVGLLKK